MSGVQGHVVLVGAGHANLLVVRGAKQLRDAGLAVTLVDPDAFWYSGMAAAVLGGAVHPGRDRVDPAPLAASRDVQFVAGRVVGLDADTGRVEVDDGTVLDATAVVVNVGSEVDPRGLPTDRPEVVTAKPIRGLVALHDRIVEGPAQPRVVIVGGGATALEAAGNLSAGPVADVVAPQVTVVAGRAPLAVIDDAALRERLVGTLRDRDVAWLVGPRAEDITDDGVVLDDGTTVPADHVILATGLRAAPAIAALGLGDARGMPTTTTLQHIDHPRVLGAGDAIRFAGDGLPRLGVFAVRQAPVLLDNLVALHTGAALRPYEPQSTWITAIDLGGGDAVLARGARWYGGPGSLLAKRLLDEWFLRRHRVPLGSAGTGWSPR